jgi:lambda family phage minor tail protein L
MDLFHLFSLDLSPISGGIYYFHEYDVNQVNFNGNFYSSMPIDVDGFEITSKGLPTPTIKISNIFGTIGALVRGFDGLQGAKITRTTLKTQPDGFLYTNADVIGLPDIYIIDRPTGHTSISITFELKSIFDLNNNKFPKRTILQSTCPLVYGSSECSVPITVTYPTCPRNIDACLERVQLQTGEGNPELPIGSFPGVNKFAG